MSRKILVNIGPYETRAALIDKGQLIELFFEIKDSAKVVGCIFKGRVAKVIPGTQSAFVNIGLQKDAFLALNEVESFFGDDDTDLKDIFKTPIQNMLKPGQEVIVQILKEPTPMKGPRSTLTLSFPGRYLVLTPTLDHIGISRSISSHTERDRLRKIGKRICPNGMGVIFRTVAEGLDERELHADLRMLLKIWQKVEQKGKKIPPKNMIHRDISLPLKLVRDFLTDNTERFIVDSTEEYKNILEICDFLSPLQRAALELHTDAVPLFEAFGVEKEIEKALDPKVWLESGGYLFIEKTEALTAIDVNSGRFSGGSDLEETVFKVNMEAAKEIAHQIRFRNLAGMIIIDFIDMQTSKHRNQVLKTLKEALKGDRNRPNVLDMTESGLVQITRRRTSHSLEEFMKIPCPCCSGNGVILSPATIGNKIRQQVISQAERFETKKIKVSVSREVADFLKGKDGRSIKELEERTKRKVIFEVRQGTDLESFKVEPVL